MMLGPDTDPGTSVEETATLEVFGGRPYAITGGRTAPSTELDMLSLVRATGHGSVSPNDLNHSHFEALTLCHKPISVAEVAAQLGIPLTATKILLSDLIQLGVVIARFPPPTEYTTDTSILEAVIDGLRRLP